MLLRQPLSEVARFRASSSSVAAASRRQVLLTEALGVLTLRRRHMRRSTQSESLRHAPRCPHLLGMPSCRLRPDAQQAGADLLVRDRCSGRLHSRHWKGRKGFEQVCHEVGETAHWQAVPSTTFESDTSGLHSSLAQECNFINDAFRIHICITGSAKICAR